MAMHGCYCATQLRRQVFIFKDLVVSSSGQELVVCLRPVLLVHTRFVDNFIFIFI